VEAVMRGAALAAGCVIALAAHARAAPVDEVLDELEAEDDDGSAQTPPFDDILPGAPPIREVISAAYTASGLDHDPSRSWIRRARIAGLVPWVTVRAGQDTSWQDRDPNLSHQTTFEVRATWRLDRLLFDSRELEVASIEASRRRERRRLANRVIRSYFIWLRAKAAAARHVRWASHADEAQAELDALTDGWFSAALARAAPRHDVSEPRTP
jgi:hypothetical protein